MRSSGPPSPPTARSGMFSSATRGRCWTRNDRPPGRADGRAEPAAAADRRGINRFWDPQLTGAPPAAEWGRSATGGRVAKRRPKKPAPVAGDTFAVPLEGGRFAVCRVLAVSERGDMVLVANADWIGRREPDAQDPALRSVLRLTHHSWGGRPSAAWVSGAPPEDFILIGNIPRGAGEDAIPEPGTGGWPFFRIQPHEQWLWDHPEDV